MQARSISPRKHNRGSSAPTTPGFLEAAGHERSLDGLIALFQERLQPYGITEHHCSRLALGWHAIPLFGTMPAHADQLRKHMAAGRPPDLTTRPALIPAAHEQGSLMTFPVLMGAGDPLIISLGLKQSQDTQIERQQRAQLNGLSTIYAMRALPLWEINEDIETACPLTLGQRTILAMILSGHTHGEIADRLDRSLGFVALQITQAKERLNVSDDIAAVALAARRGWLCLPYDS